jgi:hypothetical protein
MTQATPQLAPPPKPAERPLPPRGPRRQRWHRRIAHLFRAGLFLAFLAAPGILLPIKYEWEARGAWEDVAPPPGLPTNVEQLELFPRRFEAFVRSNFGLRKDFINLSAKLGLGGATSGSGGTVIDGEGDWLFLGEAGIIANYRGTHHFSQAHLEAWRKAIESRRDWLAARGIDYVLVIPPDKHTIYGERYLPARINRVSNVSRLDQLIEYLATHSDIEIVDLRPRLREVSGHELCYLPRDTHWNPLGAYWGYRVLAERLARHLPEVEPLDLADLEPVVSVSDKPDDLPRLKGLRESPQPLTRYRWPGGWRHALEDLQPLTDSEKPSLHANGVYQATLTRNPDGRAGRAMLIHDSFFAGQVQRLLAEHFGEMMCVWGEHDLFPTRDIEAFAPRIVVQEIVERKLMEISEEMLIVVE